MSTYARLLDVQDHDTQLEQLRHRRANLPSRLELANTREATAKLTARRGEVRSARDELGRSQSRLEDEIAMVEEKHRKEEANLYSGTITAPRELQALQAEIEALTRRQGQLEDEDLEIMVALEPIDAELSTIDAELGVLAAEEERLTGMLAADEAEIDAQVDRAGAERKALAEQIDATALADYESLRTSLGGIAIAPLEGPTCGGCHLRLSAMEVDRIRRLPEDARVTCEECGRLLVR